MKSKVCTFADDNTLYRCDKEIGTVISNLKFDMTNISNWFRYNSVKDNPDKFQFMILGPTDDKCFILKVNSIEIRNTFEVELLGLKIDHKLKFDAPMCMCVCLYVHPMWRHHLSGLREIRGNRSTMLCWRCFIPLPVAFITTLECRA